ncbi:MAG: FadR/GntR family transcriptional regulator [Parvibaculaceae bacterium]
MTWELVTRHIEEAILNGIVGPGERLPPERELARQLTVSRSVLRAALKDLADRGLIRTTQGGGNFVNQIIGKQMSDPLAALLKDSPDAHLDFMEYRAEFEGSAAALATLRATPPDLQVISLIYERMKAVHDELDVNEEARLDVDFHMAIAEATHNIVFIHISQSMRELMQQEFLNSRLMLFHRTDGRERILEQHGAILNAIVEGDAARAKQAMRDHIDYVTDIYRELERFEKRKEIALQRLSRWEGSLGPSRPQPAGSPASGSAKPPGKPETA